MMNNACGSRKDLKRFLSFKELRNFLLTKIVYTMKRKRIDKGLYLYRKGEEVNYLTIIQDGLIEVLVNLNILTILDLF